MSEAAKAIVGEWLEQFRLPELVDREAVHPEVSNLSEILAVVGPRRSGKTFFFFQLIRDLIEKRGVARDRILFVDFEDYRLPYLGKDPAGELLTAFQQVAGHAPEYLFLDEVQQLPDWSRVVRTLHNRRAFKILISGSNSKLLSRKLSTELRGRCLELAMLPFSFPEFLRFKKIQVTTAMLHTESRGRIIAAFEDYLTGGGFPGVVACESALERRRLLQGYYQTTYYKVLERYDIRAKETLSAMMRHVVDQAGELFSISAFTKTLKQRGIESSKRTVANYLSHLQEAFFVIATEKFAYSQRQRTANLVKCYLLDTGFKQLAVNFSANRGKMLENLVAIELRRRGKEFFYFRNKGECDFVLVEENRPVSAIQVCWEIHDQNRKRETAGLREALAELGIQDGRILSFDGKETVDEFRQTPVWQWLLEPPATL
ncbi:MAG: ATP-binding protein [Spartobacteria bacterium]